MKGFSAAVGHQFASSIKMLRGFQRQGLCIFLACWIARLLSWLFIFGFLLPATARGQFTFITNNSTITITKYTNSGGVVQIPDKINNLPVTRIGNDAFDSSGVTSVTFGTNVTDIGSAAFFLCSSLTNVTLPGSLLNISNTAFAWCSFLTNVVIPNHVVNIGSSAFSECTCLASIVIPDSVTNLGTSAFDDCSRLTNAVIGAGVSNVGTNEFYACYNLASVTLPKGLKQIRDDAFFDCGLRTIVIPGTVSNPGKEAFMDCHDLTGVYFQGDATAPGTSIFDGDDNAIVYYLPGTSGWTSTYGGRPAVLWNPRAVTTNGIFGIRTNRFGFNIAGTTNIVVVVEASTNLTQMVWTPVITNILTNGTCYFSDSQWTNYRSRFYRFRAP